MKTSISKVLKLLCLVLLFQNCTSDDRDIEIQTLEGDYVNGLFVLNEGGYTYSNASVSFIDGSGTVYNNIFYGVNQMELGDVAQSMAFYNDQAYIVLNYSNTIQVVNRYTFEHIATIDEQILNPRYMVFNDGKGYATNWGDPADATDDYIAVIDLETNTVENRIAVSEGPERILLYNNTIYVAHKGGWGYGNSLSVIKDETVTDTIELAYVPNGMQVSGNYLYVLCSGKADWTGDETLAKIFKVNMDTNQVEETLEFSSGQHPNFTEIADNKLYYVLDRDIFSIDLSAFELPSEALFSTLPQDVQVLYGFRVYNNKIYVADAKDYVSNGSVFIYDMQGNLQQDYQVQIIPNGFYFND